MKSSNKKLPTQNILLCLAAIILSSAVSCSPAPDPMLDLLDSQLANLKIDNVSRTMQFVVSPVRFQKKEFEEKLAASLNRWAKSESKTMTPDKWQVDGSASELLKKYNSLQSVEKISELTFLNTDSYLVQQRFWFDRLGKRLIANPDLDPFEIQRLAASEMEISKIKDSEDGSESDPLAEILLALHEGISAEDAVQLANALKMFDWVTRNIHLLPENDLTSGTDDLESLKLNDAEDLAAAGVPGLGYTRFPWQTMLFSRGDYVERAKIFMSMIDQFGIESVMLTPEIESDGEKMKKPWVVAVNIGGNLYLFDTKLGLPIPGSSPGTIATLADAQSNAEILDSLDLSVDESLKDDTKYWVKQDQIKNVDALVLATPESMSYRFWELESKLVGDERVKLVLNPSEVTDTLPELEGVDYGIWDIEFKTHQFRRSMRDAIAESSFKDDIRDKIRWYFNDELYINEFVQYRTARAKYFVGLFETIRNDGNLNSIELFYKMIYKDSKIDSLAVDKVFQNQMAVSQGAQSSADFANMIASVQANMRLVRRDSGFYLSQCHFDNGNFGTATNWLTRLEEIEDTSRWQPAINYLRARSLEAQRDYDSAIEIYNKQESEQFHGDLIRARMLMQLK